MESNLLQILLTFFMGVSVYLISSVVLTKLLVCKVDGEDVCIYIEKLIQIIIWLVMILLTSIYIIYFLFDLGEAYQYSLFYKRNFGPFGDGFPFLIILPVCYALFNRSILLMLISILPIFISGSKITIIALMVVLVLSRKAALSPFPLRKLIGVAVGAWMLYFLLLITSNLLVTNDFKRKFQESVQILSSGIITKNSRQGADACVEYDRCFKTQLLQPIKQRFITSVAGVWMTAQGGFPGKLYPTGRERFAGFMMDNNPYGVNKIFGLTFVDWYRAGAIQNAFLRLGSGYGRLPLFIVIGSCSIFCLVGFKQLKNRQLNNGAKSLILFFLILFLVNHTQPWIQSGSPFLFLFGIAVATVFSDLFSFRKSLAQSA